MFEFFASYRKSLTLPFSMMFFFYQAALKIVNLAAVVWDYKAQIS